MISKVKWPLSGLMTEENRLLDHLSNNYDGPVGENPKENNLNENKPAGCTIWFQVQGNQPLVCKTDKCWTKVWQKTVWITWDMCPYPSETAQQTTVSITAVLSQDRLSRMAVGRLFLAKCVCF